jgi:hypothetical protein
MTEDAKEPPDYFAGFSDEQRTSLLRIVAIQEENFRRVERGAKERVLRAAVVFQHLLGDLQARLGVLEAALKEKGVVSSAELEALRKEASASAALEATLNEEFRDRVERDQQELDTWVETRVRKLMEGPPLS